MPRSPVAWTNETGNPGELLSIRDIAKALVRLCDPRAMKPLLVAVATVAREEADALAGAANTLAGELRTVDFFIARAKKEPFLA